MSSFKIAVFVSGNGSNLQSLIDTNKIKNEQILSTVMRPYRYLKKKDVYSSIVFDNRELTFSSSKKNI